MWRCGQYGIPSGEMMQACTMMMMMAEVVEVGIKIGPETIEP